MAKIIYPYQWNCRKTGLPLKEAILQMGPDYPARRWYRAWRWTFALVIGAGVVVGALYMGAQSGLWPNPLP